MKLQGKTIVFESEALAVQALADLYFCIAMHEERERTRAAFAAFSPAALERMSRGMAEDLRGWDLGLALAQTSPRNGGNS